MATSASQKVEGVLCVYLMGVPTLQAVVKVRYEGTDSALVVPFGTPEAIQAAFEAAYRQRFAFLMSERAVRPLSLPHAARALHDRGPGEPRRVRRRLPRPR